MNTVAFLLFIAFLCYIYDSDTIFISIFFTQSFLLLGIHHLINLRSRTKPVCIIPESPAGSSSSIPRSRLCCHIRRIRSKSIHKTWPSKRPSKQINWIWRQMIWKKLNFFQFNIVDWIICPSLVDWYDSRDETFFGECFLFRRYFEVR